MTLVKDVTFGVLDDEEDAERESRFRLRLSIIVVRCSEAER